MNHQEAVDTLASERYLLGEMTEIERHAFEDHYFDCAECAADVRAGAVMQEAARAGAAEGEPRRGEVRPFPARPRVVSRLAPWAVAASLALVAGYESLVVVPTLRRETMPRAMTPITLRPAVRGAMPTVARDRSGSPAEFAVDMNGPTSGELAYELRAPGGSRTVEGRAQAPAPGMPLFLLFPAEDLTQPGEYDLRVYDPADPSRPAGDYRFAVTAQ